ncbi:MAG TPA: NADH-quinone oxidoreductase subunit J [Steroidobacteraceae bacterium]|nr:NADH-quinone oxidoreductase subunit J [Steroidobacteraceae bacterium]
MSIDTVLLYFFGIAALAGGVLMLVAQHPMRVALALIAVMLSLAGVYAMLGVHAVAVFQVLIYVGAVMVFMVYVIMLLDVRDPSFVRRYSRLLLPGVALGALLVGALGLGMARLGGAPEPAAGAEAPSYLVRPFSQEFLQQYWLHFELTSVLLVAAVVAAIAVIRSGGRQDG